MAEQIEQATTTSETPEFATQAEYRAYRSKSPVAEVSTEDVETEPSATEEVETAEEPETSEDITQEIEEPAKPKKKATLSEEKQRLLDEVTALRKERRDLKTPDIVTPKVDAPVPQPTPKDEELPPYPQFSQFDYDEAKYATAMQEWNLKAIQVERAKEARQAQQQQAQSKWVSAVEAAKAKNADFESIAFNPETMRYITPVMSEVVTSTTDMALALHLGNNPKEAQRISALPPNLQSFEMGKLAAKLSTPEKTVTPKPALSVPVNLAAAGGGTTRKELGEARNMSEYRKIKAQLLKK